VKPLVYSLWSIALVTGGLACGLFLAQGGFGAGHLRFDRVLVLLGFPWTFISWPQVVVRYDFVWLVLLPTLINLVLLVALTTLLRRR
jgi:hypothetical protein